MKLLKGMQCHIKLKQLKKKDPIVQLKASKLSFKNFLSDLLNETKGFKYQMIVIVLLKNTSWKWRN